MSFKFEIVICKLYQFGRVQNLLFGKGLNDAILDLFFTEKKIFLSGSVDLSSNCMYEHSDPELHCLQMHPIHFNALPSLHCKKTQRKIGKGKSFREIRRIVFSLNLIFTWLTVYHFNFHFPHRAK